jgi:hypothetical protein
MAIAGAFAVLFPSIRRIDTFDELEPEPVGAETVAITS